MAKPSEGNQYFRSRDILAKTAILTLIIEAATAFARFGLGLQATRDTASILSPLTCGIRIHHAYIGVLVIVAALFLKRRPTIFAWLISLGLALVLSDLAHHFLVLWPLTGDPELHLVYP